MKVMKGRRKEKKIERKETAKEKERSKVGNVILTKGEEGLVVIIPVSSECMMLSCMSLV